MRRPHHVFLVPGFFGFVNFGRLVYFSHVREHLETAFGRRGLGVVVHRARLSPTGSLVRRASELRDFLAENLPETGRDPVHIIGHSTGGLDARLLLSPGVQLSEGAAVEPLARRIQSLVTVATPHRGAPLASFFTSVLGQRLLRLISIATIQVLREGRLPASVVARAGAALARDGGKTEAVLEQLATELAGQVADFEQGPVVDFVDNLGADQALLPQLTPEGTALFNATTADRPGVRYGCVLTRAPRPTLRHRLRVGLHPYRHLTYTAFQLLHGHSTAGWAAVAQREGWLTELRDVWSSPVRGDDSDGVVPTSSQRWGAVLHAATADHLDVIGHFDDPRHQPPHIDWIDSEADFDRARFEALWGDVVDYLVG
jgi:triacylglycerol lipase